MTLEERTEQISLIVNRLQVCILAQELIIDHPEKMDDCQRRAAQTKKHLGLVIDDVRKLLDLPTREEIREAVASLKQYDSHLGATETDAADVRP